MVDVEALGARGPGRRPIGFTIGPWRSGDELAICELFERTFRTRKSVDQWRWQFLESARTCSRSSPGPHVVVARDRDGRILAHFGSIPRRARFPGGDGLFAQVVDSMVDPDAQHGLRNPGLFTEVVRSYVDHFGRPESEVVAYGLPTHAAFRIGARFSGYARIEALSLFAKEIGRAAASPIDVAVSSRAEPDHDELWRIAAPALEYAIVRDRDYVRWRYERCPSARYRFLSARRAGRLAAMAVFRDHSHVEPGCGTLVDLLWDGDDRDALAAVVLRAEEVARAAELHHVVVMCAAHARELAVLRELGYRPIPTELFLVARSFHAPLGVGNLRGRWWYTAGDFDLE